MSYQFLIDHAESLSINRRKLVATTTARDGTTRAVSRGTPLARITITLPDGLPWDQIRSNIVAMEALDKVTTDTITIPYEGYEWYYGNSVPAVPDSFSVRCIEFPDWAIFARNQVSWAGPFVLQVQ